MPDRILISNGFAVEWIVSYLQLNECNRNVHLNIAEEKIKSFISSSI